MRNSFTADIHLLQLIYRIYCRISAWEFLHRRNVKRVRIRSYSGPHFSRIFPDWIRTEYGEMRSISPYSVQMRESPGKMRTRITPNTDSFYVVNVMFMITNSTELRMGKLILRGDSQMKNSVLNVNLTFWGGGGVCCDV